MTLAGGLMIFFVTNIEKFLNTLTLFLECTSYFWFCSALRTDVPETAILAVIILFMITAAIATIRRVRNTPVSNYWAVLLLVLITLDYQYLTGLDVIWQGDPGSGLFQLPVPWFLLTAIALIFLLSFASEKSEYFMSGYWNADPPLGYGLSLSSFWLLAFSATKLASIQAIAFDNPTLWQVTQSIETRIENMVPQTLTSPVIPAVIFMTSAVLLVILGHLKQAGSAAGNSTRSQELIHRRQRAIQTTKAAQSINGLKL